MYGERLRSGLSDLQRLADFGFGFAELASLGSDMGFRIDFW